MTPDSDADYSYADPAPAYAPSSPSILWPFALLSCAVAMIMIIQTQGVFQQKSALQEGKLQLADTVTKREPALKQVAEIKSKANAMTNPVDERESNRCMKSPYFLNDG